MKKGRSEGGWGEEMGRQDETRERKKRRGKKVSICETFKNGHFVKQLMHPTKGKERMPGTGCTEIGKFKLSSDLQRFPSP